MLSMSEVVHPKLKTENGLNIDLHSKSAPCHYRKHVEKVCETVLCDNAPHIDLAPSQKMYVVPIHQRPDLLVPCADLINSEWQRSQAARVHSLQKSCPDFPVCLVLLRNHGETEQLLGHAQLSRVVGHSSSLFVGSVVVSKLERGKGYGRTLMDKTESYAKSRGFKRLCLTTHDKQHFYAHLGYTLSTPVQSAGAMTAFVSMETLLRLSKMSNGNVSNQKPIQTEMGTQVKEENQNSGPKGGTESPGSLLPPPAIPPPPPPPLPSIPPSHPYFPSYPVSPLIPPPPSLPSAPPSIPTSPAQPQAVECPVVQTLTDTPYRDAKGAPIFWMHKDI